MCKAVLPALRSQIKGTQARIFNMLLHFMRPMSDDTHPPALTVLLSNGILDLAMVHMADAGANEIPCAVGLFQQFLRHPWGQERMSKKAMMDQVIQWIAKWLSEVRDSGPLVL